MKSKEKTLAYYRMNEPGHKWCSMDAAYSAMDEHARNVAVEFARWYWPLPKVDAERIVNDFLQSDYLKERITK